MSLLTPAKKETAFAKVGLLGFAGSGKTLTASRIGIGLARMMNSKKPVAFLDTETGSDYVIDLVKKAGLELVVAKTRAFSDLLDVAAEAEKSCDVMIADSISHPWQELVESYQQKHKLKRLSFQHWGPIKKEWRKFTDLYLTSRLHFIIAGRAAWEYDMTENEEGDKDLVKTGTRMRVEGDMGYEPSLLLEMVRINRDMDAQKNSKRKKSAAQGSGWIHRCYVLKDRTDLINGQAFDNPTFENFLPVFNCLNIGGEHRVLDTSRTSQAMIENPDWSAEDRRRLQKIYSEEIEGLLTSALPGQAAKDKKLKADILQAVFNSRSWTGICDMRPEVLKEGVKAVDFLCQAIEKAEQTPEDVLSWLGDRLEDRRRRELQDDIPDFKAGDGAQS